MLFIATLPQQNGTLLNNCNLAAAKLIFSAIDTLAGFFTGRLSQDRQIKSSYITFLKKYGPQFFRHDLNQLLRKNNNKTFNNYAEILFFIFRNGLIHDSSLGMGVSIYRDGNDNTLFRSNGVEIMEINLDTFYKWFKDVLKLYENDLKTKKSIYRKWDKKYREIISPIFELDIKERILDDLKEKGRITTIEVAHILNQSQSTARRVLDGVLDRKGSGPSTHYVIK